MFRITVIDDDPTVLSLFKQFLEGEGYDVSLTSDGHEGLKLIEAEPPDLIITDIMMPEMDGLEIIQNVRKILPDVPIIAISGGLHAAPINFLPHAKKFGANRAFEKPAPLSEVLAAIKELLNEKPDS